MAEFLLGAGVFGLGVLIGVAIVRGSIDAILHNTNDKD